MQVHGGNMKAIDGNRSDRSNDRDNALREGAMFNRSDPHSRNEVGVIKLSTWLPHKHAQSLEWIVQMTCEVQCVCRKYVRFSNTDTLTLTTADATDKVVSNLCVDGMRQAEYSHNNISHMLSIAISRNARDSIAGC